MSTTQDSGQSPDSSYPEGLYLPAGRGWCVSSLHCLGHEALSRYEELGYVMVENVFSAEQVGAAIDALDDLLAKRPPGFEGIHVEAGRRRGAAGSAATPTIDDVRKFSYFTNHESRLRALSEYPPLIAILEQIVGEPVRLFQDMALLKPPGGGREKPWHQDQAYFDYPVDTKVVGVWIALDEALVENGCMHLIPGSHRDGPAPHVKRRDWQICDEDVIGATCVTAPLKPGGILLFDGLLKHGTPENASPLRRRALQFHYLPSSAKETPEADRLRVFGAHGKDATC